MKKLLVGSLFSGCGGFDLGFRGGFKFLDKSYGRLPFSTAYACDMDRDALGTMVANLGEEGFPAFFVDARAIPTGCLPEVDVLLAGFPCQPFSMAGSRRGTADPRGTLFRTCVRILRDTKPSCFVFENVQGILSSRTPDGRPVVDVIVKAARAAGYRVHPPVLAKADRFGVGQTRKRVILVGFRDKAALARFSFPGESGPPPTLREVLSGVEEAPQQDILYELEPMAAAMVPHVVRSWKDVPDELLPPRLKEYRRNSARNHSPVIYRRHGWDEVAGTLTAQAQPERGAILHPEAHRRYTVREAARIQSFPDDFLFYGHRARDCMRIIGNAVPPVLAWRIAERVALALSW